jgi:lipopolysaccharide export system protein LptC
MPKTLVRKLLVLALLVIAVVSWQWLDERSPGEESQAAAVSPLSNETNYFLQGFDIESVSSDSDTRIRIQGDVLASFLDSGESRVSNPRVGIDGANNQTWQGEASSGVLSADYSTLQLEGGVRLTHRQRSDADTITLTTESVLLDTRDQTLISQSAVQLSAPGWSFNANGLQANLANGHLLFPSSVEARYAPAP